MADARVWFHLVLAPPPLWTPSVHVYQAQSDVLPDAESSLPTTKLQLGSMNNPFNPDRFLYEDSSDPDPYSTRNPSSGRNKETSPRPFGYSLERDRPSPEIPPAPSARATVTNGPNEATSTGRGHKKTGFYLQPHSGLGVLLLIVFAYIFGGLVERSRLLAPAHIPSDVKAYIDQAVLRLSRDSIGLRDFALYANGGRVIRELTRIPENDVLALRPVDNSPNASLSDDLHVGNCWKFPGEAAQLGFRTSEMLYPTHVTIDHIPLEIAADIGQAPRSMALWAAVDGSRNAEYLNTILASPSSHIPGHLGRTQPRFDEGLTFLLLTAFTYDIHSPNYVQTFPIDFVIVDARIFFGVFVLDILSNWGGEATCVYRVRIHGESALL